MSLENGYKEQKEKNAIVEAIRNALIVANKEGKTETQVVDLFEQFVRAIVQEELEEYESYWDKFDDQRIL
jgi:hypothetical protein